MPDGMQAKTYLDVIRGLGYIRDKVTDPMYGNPDTKMKYVSKANMYDLVLDVKEACETILEVIKHDDGRELTLPALTRGK